MQQALRVLVVDDSLDGAAILGLLLNVAGHQCRTVHDGSAVLEAVLDYKPDVVLLDIGLPGLNGYEVAKKIRQQPTLNKTVLVALTGYGRESDRQSSQEAGFDYHLVKPVIFEDIERILESISEKLS